MCFLLVAFPPRLMGRSCERTHNLREMHDLKNPFSVWSSKLRIIEQWTLTLEYSMNHNGTHQTTIVQVRSLSNGWRHLHNYGISWKHTGGWTSNLDASQDSYPSNSSSKKIPFSEEKKNCPKLNKLHNPIRSPPAAGYFSWVVNQIVHEMHVLPFLILFVGDNFSEDKKSFFLFLLQLSRFYQDWIFFCWKNAAELYSEVHRPISYSYLQFWKSKPINIFFTRLSLYEKKLKSVITCLFLIGVVQLQYVLIFTWRLKGKGHLSMSSTLEFVWNHAISKTFDKIFITFNCTFKNGSNWKSSTFFLWTPNMQM